MLQHPLLFYKAGKKLEETDWLLILGRTGILKKRESDELAKLVNRDRWTVLQYCWVKNVQPWQIHPTPKLTRGFAGIDGDARSLLFMEN